MFQVGNKLDLEIEREVRREEGENLALKHGAMFRESSAKERENVQSIFYDIVRYLWGNIEKKPPLIDWESSKFFYFPISFQKSVFCFLCCLFLKSKQFSLKIPKPITHLFFSFLTKHILLYSYTHTQNDGKNNKKKIKKK